MPVQDEVAVVGDHGAALSLGHAELGFASELGLKDSAQILAYLSKFGFETMKKYLSFFVQNL